MIFADVELTGWPLAFVLSVVIFVVVICMTKVITDDWPW